VLVADGAGVTTWEGDVVGTTVEFGVLAPGVGLPGRVLEAGLGVAAGRDGSGTDLAGAAGRTGAGDSVAERSALKCR
jgi:hypothetical protein